MTEFKKKVQSIIEDYCEGINHLEFSIDNFPEMLDRIETEALHIHDVVGRNEQLKAEDKDLPFADYLEKWYEPPRYEKVYDRKDGKGTDTEDEVIKNYIRAFRL